MGGIDGGVVTGKGENGPSVDDLGGYTRFNYEKKHSEFVWRAPFEGMLYQKNSHSDPMDDMVSYSEGKKQIYYLHSIETKTHVAFFRTSARKDGLEAVQNAWAKGSGHGTDGLNKLDEIELYTVSDCERYTDGTNKGNLKRDVHGSPILLKVNGVDPKPIKTVKFDYDYSLCKSVPNSENLETGKLTLKRVYTEYNGIHETRISPYNFSYEYPTTAEYAAFPSKYNSGDYDVTAGYGTNATNGLSELAQNPVYNPFLSDAWGNYQGQGLERFQKIRPWLNQKNQIDFDPAAWQLKVITLPSGGEIHVQYEQDDYSYVQDQEAHVMVPLTAMPTESEVVINHAEIGLTNSDLKQLKTMIDQRYVLGKKKIYFKLLYSLTGSNTPDLATCNADFISGYSSISGCALDDNTNPTKLTITLSDKHPRDLCKEFVKAQRLGKIDPSANCDPSRGVSDPNDPKALVNQLLNLAGGIIAPSTLCQQINPEYSYLRIPTPRAKKGGGTRVKRLMMFDKGLEGNPVLYGSHYTYETMERGTGRIISSGVATNEPQTIREENILVDFVARKNQDTWSRIIAGKDRDKAEGPLGESILPGASVGYAKVIVRNIYSEKGNPGFTISEFNTAYSHPITLAHPDKKESMTDIDRNDLNPFPLSMPFFTYIKSKTSAVQGFSFVLNSMHGQPASTTSYSGPYDDIHTLAKSSEVSRMVYEYYKPGERIPMMSSLYEGVKLKNPGREVDITFAQRKVEELSDDLNVEIDFQLTVIPLAFVILVIPYPTATPAFSHIEGELNTHATTKVVRYPAILKKTTVTQNGLTHEEENLAFDEYTGNPVSVRSTDEFKGAYLAQSIPASWEYPEMGGKWKNQGKKITGSFTMEGEYLKLGDDPCNLAIFSRGDKIRIGGISSTSFYYVAERDYINNRLRIQLARDAATTTGAVTEITVVHSGKTNQLQQQAGSITSQHEVKSALAPPIADASNRYSDGSTNDGNQNFAADLKAETQSLTGEGQFTLSGTYSQIDMNGFADKLSGCNIDLSIAKVKELTFTYVVQDTQVSIQLMEFKIECAPGNFVTVKAEGWE